MDLFATLAEFSSSDALDFLDHSSQPHPNDGADNTIADVPLTTTPDEEDHEQSMFSKHSSAYVTAVPALNVTPSIHKIRAGGRRNDVSPITETIYHPNASATITHSSNSLFLDADMKRKRHNQMMRENRERTNRKFSALETLLQRCACSNVPCSRPMRNKMQVLDRAMVQYPAMRARCALLRAQLVLAEPSYTSNLNIPGATPDSLARLLLVTQEWNAAEIWSVDGRDLISALLAPKNTWATANRIKEFSSDAMCVVDEMVVKARKIAAPLWIPDLRVTTGVRAETAKKAGVSTSMYIPVSNRVVALYHVDDELLPLEGAIRPYDVDTLARVEQLAKALHLVDARRCRGAF